MISTFQRNQHFRKVSVIKTFTHVQEQKKAMSSRHSAYIPSNVKSPLVKVLCKQITLSKHSDFFHGSISFSEGKKLIHSFHIHEKNSLKNFRSLNSIALIDQTKA